MLRKIKKFLIILSISFLSFVLSSCDLGIVESYTLREGKFEYSEELMILNDSFQISYIRIIFTQSENVFGDVNTIVSRYDNKAYYVELYLENENHEGFYCDFVDRGIDNQHGRYHLEIDVSNFLNVENATFQGTFTLHHHSSLGKEYNIYEKPDFNALLFRPYSLYVNENQIPIYTRTFEFKELREK